MKVRLINFHCLVRYADASNCVRIYTLARQIQIDNVSFHDLLDLVELK